MDDLVKQAMQKWPNVPHCYGWLGLDMRGDWYMRDDQVQSQGEFAIAKGSKLQHHKLIEFIQRNYLADIHGQWYFQNGPQRVYVELEATPWVWRIGTGFHIEAHDGTHAEWQQCFTDEHGWLYCLTKLGFGLVHTQDMGHAANAIEQGVWNVAEASRADLPGRFGYVCSPQALQATKKPVQ